MLSQLLTEIDSAHNIGDIFVIAATNRPDMLDTSLLRPGRIDLPVYVPPPDEKGRLAVLQVAASKMPLAKDISLAEIARQSVGYSGADLEALCREAAISALNGSTAEGTLSVTRKDFDAAFKNIKPSVTPETISWYESVYEKMSNRLPKFGKRDFYG